jgi:predicted nucleic acid-binding protein
VKRLVIDAGALVGWFDGTDEHRALRAEYEAGTLTVIAPRGVVADVLGVLATRGVTQESLARIGAELLRIGLQLQDPPMEALAVWLSRGLAPNRAAYAALAGSLEIPLVTDDPDLRRVAAPILLRG